MSSDSLTSSEYYDAMDFELNSKVYDSNLVEKWPEVENSEEPNTWSKGLAKNFMIRDIDYHTTKNKIPSQESPYEAFHTCLVENSTQATDEIEKFFKWSNVFETKAPTYVLIRFKLGKESAEIFFRLKPNYASCPRWKDIEENIVHFMNADDKYRNEKMKFFFKLSGGSKLFHTSINAMGAQRPTRIGKTLKTDYRFGKGYLEINIDVNSSSIASMIKGKVFKYLSNLFIEMGMALEGQTEHELPEIVLFHIKWNKIDVKKVRTTVY